MIFQINRFIITIYFFKSFEFYIYKWRIFTTVKNSLTPHRLHPRLKQMPIIIVLDKKKAQSFAYSVNNFF